MNTPVKSDEERYACVNCGTLLPADYDPAYCCNGHDCACMGRETNPMVCSEKCFYEAYPAMKNDRGDSSDPR